MVKGGGVLLHTRSEEAKVPSAIGFRCLVHFLAALAFYESGIVY